MLLCELGCLLYQLIDCIDRNGGYSITRPAADADPRIFRELKSHYRLGEWSTRKAHVVENLLPGACVWWAVSAQPTIHADSLCGDDLRSTFSRAAGLYPQSKSMKIGPIWDINAFLLAQNDEGTSDFPGTLPYVRRTPASVRSRPLRGPAPRAEAPAARATAPPHP